MGAPVEIFAVLDNDDTSYKIRGWNTKGGTLPKDLFTEIRYLRADLTCGECWHRNEIPAVKKFACTRRGMYVAANEPFCGDFKPR